MKRDLEGFIVLFVIILSLGGLAIASTIDSKPNTIEISVSNPYNWDVDIELQCDWNNNKHEYEVHQFLLFAGHSIQTIIVPGNTKHCNIWPHVRLWD